MKTKEELQWLKDRSDIFQNRSHEAETFILQLAQMNWFQRAFAFKKIMNFLKTVDRYYPNELTETSVSYLIHKIKNIKNQFPHLTIRYEYDYLDNDHIIEITPSSEFWDNQNYMKIEDEIRHDFIKHFPYELLTFITEGSVSKIEKVTFKI